MPQSKEPSVRHILKLSDGIFNAMPINVPVEWLSSDLTLAQLRLLLVLNTKGPMRMSDIAAALDIALPTATGIVENLVKKKFTARETDPSDRRLVICRLSAGGQHLINRLWISGQSQMENLLEGLTSEQLEKAADVARILFDNISRKNGGPGGEKVK